MNHYKFKDLSVGMTETFTRMVTEEMLRAFFHTTGDINPLHNDTAYAKSMGYTDRVVYGMLTASFLSTLAGVYMPGEHSLIQSVEVKFVAPVYIGDELTITGRIEELNDTMKQISLKVEVLNQNHIKVLRAKMKIGVLCEE